MSTLHTANLFPTWKEEVNRRVAEHMSRRAPGEQTEAHAEAYPGPSRRGARAAARVAARYAGAPSYSQMLAEEARAAMRAAQAAQNAAQIAHAAAQMVLAGLEGALPPQSSLESDRLAHARLDPAAQYTQQAVADQPSPTPAEHEADLQTESNPFAAMRLEPPAPARNSAAAHEFGPAAEPQPLPANLIQFPREMVAPRRIRARRVEGPLAALDSAAQLSIFEVDPAAISTQPASATAEQQSAPDWMRPGWAAADSGGTQAREETLAETALQAPGFSVAGLAPVSRRLLAIVVDGSLTLAAFLGVLALATASGIHPHSLRAFELTAAFVLLSVCAGYQMLFSALTKATPGMWYAGTGLCTLDGLVAARSQRFRRLSLLPLSVFPLGLGLAWSLFDEDRLTWHDRLSGTYPRSR